MQPKVTDPPPIPNRRVNWDEITDLCTQRPGKWVLAGTFKSSGSRTPALRRGLEATLRSTDAGWELYVRSR